MPKLTLFILSAADIRPEIAANPNSVKVLLKNLGA